MSSHVRETMLAEKEREFGAKSMEVGVALYKLGTRTESRRQRQEPTCWSARSLSWNENMARTTRKWLSCWETQTTAT